MRLRALRLNGRCRTADDPQFGTRHELDGAQCILLRGVAERNGHAARAGTRRLANAVQIVEGLATDFAGLSSCNVAAGPHIEGKAFLAARQRRCGMIPGHAAELLQEHI